jgi:hypothetical protein
MKKIALVFCLILAIPLSGCTNTNAGKKDSDQNISVEESVDQNISVEESVDQNISVEESVVPLTNIQKLHKKITESFDTPKEYFKLDVIQSPGVNKERVNEIVSAYEKAINLYPMPTDRKITWVFLNENEKEWWIQKTSEIDSKPNLDWWNSRHCGISRFSVCAYGNVDTDFPIFYMVIGSLSKWDEDDQFIADHEAAHVYQMAKWKNSHSNCWIDEGYANAVGIAMSSKVADVRLYRESQISALRNIFPEYKLFSINDWVNAYNKINTDSEFCFSKSAGYSMGMIAVESMYDLYDAKILDEFFVEYSKTKNFNKTLLKYFNINETEFYKNVAVYAKSVV